MKFKIADQPDVDLDKEEIYLEDGSRLTEALAERLAEDTSRQAIELRKGGRPSLAGTKGDSVQVAFRVPDDVREAVQQLAAKEGVSMSVIVRKALDEYLTKH